MSLDPTGPLITFIDADPGVVAFPASVRGQKKQGETPPFAILRRRTARRAISGPGTDRTGVQSIDYVALCYGAKVQTGYRDAFRLAGAISSAIHQKGPLTLPAPGGAGRIGVYKITESSIGEALDDPITGEPYVPLFFNVLASADALA